MICVNVQAERDHFYANLHDKKLVNEYAGIITPIYANTTERYNIRKYLRLAVYLSPVNMANFTPNAVPTQNAINLLCDGISRFFFIQNT